MHLAVQGEKEGSEGEGGEPDKLVTDCNNEFKVD